MRRSGRGQGEHGAVAVLFAIVLAFALLPAIALATGTYVRSTTGTELQRASDSGALAGAAEVPLGNLTFADNYLSTVTGTGIGTTLSNLGISDPSVPDPLAAACNTALKDATNSDNLADAYADPPTCSAKYLAQPGPLGDLQSCLNGATQGVLGGIGGLLGGLDPTQLLSSLEPLLPALIEPGVSVTMSWHVQSPLDQVFGGNQGRAQTSTAFARRRFKNIVVIPEATLPTGQTINVDPTLQNARTLVLNTFTSLESLLSSIPLLSSCSNVLTDLQSDVADAVDPPGGGPSLNSILDDAVTSGEPILAVVIPQTLGALQIPFLDIVPVCMAQVGGTYVAHLTNFGGCVVDAPGGFRASLRNS